MDTSQLSRIKLLAQLTYGHDEIYEIVLAPGWAAVMRAGDVLCHVQTTQDEPLMLLERSLQGA